MNRIPLASLAVAVLAMATLAACSSTSLKEAWTDPEYKGQPLKRVLVIGVTENVRNRRAFEDAMVSAFRGRGVEAISSATISPPSMEIDEDMLRAKVKELNADAVLVTRMVGVEKETIYTPGTSTYTRAPRYYSFHDYYSTAYQAVYEPGYIREYDVVKLESNLYESREEKLIWSVASSSFAPQSAQEVINELSKIIIEDMARNGLVR